MCSFLHKFGIRHYLLQRYMVDTTLLNKRNLKMAESFAFFSSAIKISKTRLMCFFPLVMHHTQSLGNGLKGTVNPLRSILQFLRLRNCFAFYVYYIFAIT
jgi:hypothetical protein